MFFSLHYCKYLNLFYNITINVDVNKAKEDDLAEYDLEGLAGAQGTYDDIKEQMENSGLTCK